MIIFQVKNDSFFNFFAPPAIPENEEELDEETQELITSDFEIGHYIRERIIPRAVLFFTGKNVFLFYQGFRLMDRVSCYGKQYFNALSYDHDLLAPPLIH